MAKRVRRIAGRYNGSRAIPVRFIEDGDVAIEGGMATPIQIIPASEIDDNIIAEEPTPVYVDENAEIIGDENTLTKAYIPTEFLLLDKFTTKAGFLVDLSDKDNHFDPSNVSANVGGGIIGDAASFDGSTNYISIPASFYSDFNPSAGSIELFAKVSGSGVWSDGSWRNVFDIRVNVTNVVWLAKSSTSNRLSMEYTAGGVPSFYNHDSFSPTGYFHFVVTWDKAEDEVKFYFDNDLKATRNSIGAWVGVITSAVIGAQTSTPGQVWDGDIDLVRVYDRTLTPAEIAAHYNNGSGLAVADMTTAQKSGLILAYEFDKLESPRDAVPGPGELTRSSGNLSALSVAGGELIYDGSAAVGLDVTEPAFSSRTVGQIIMAKIKVTHVNSDAYLIQPVGGSIVDVFRILNGAFYVNNNINSGSVFVVDTYYTIAIVFRSAGAFTFVKGGAFATWTLIWISASSTATPSPRIDINSSLGSIHLSSYSITDLPAPFATDYGIATDRVAGAVAAGTAFTHEADCIIEFFVDYVTGGTAEINFRRTDDDNHYEIFIAASGNLYLYEVVATVRTAKIIAIPGFVNGNTYRIVCTATEAGINFYVENSLVGSYGTPIYQTNTSGKFIAGGGGSVIHDLVTWPRTLSGRALAQLEAV